MRRLWRFLADPLVLIPAVFLLLLVGLAAAGQSLAPYDGDLPEIPARLQAPLWAGGTTNHLLGTDSLGRDVMSRLIVGTRLSLLIPAIAVAAALVVGGTAGLVAGFYGGRIDSIIMRLADLQMAFSTLLLIIVIVVMLGPGGLTLIVVFSVAFWPIYVRVIRSAVLSTREALFVEAARSVGCRDRRIIFKHIMPTVIPTAMSLAIVEIARLMVSEAGLSFLGFGVQPPEVTWGLMIAAGREYLTPAWWLITVPGLAIAATVLAVSLIGVRLRDVASPYVDSFARKKGGS